jgi:hypothetical protein
MTAVIHLSHAVVYNVLLATVVLLLLWLLLELVGGQFHQYVPVQLLAPATL